MAEIYGNRDFVRGCVDDDASVPPVCIWEAIVEPAFSGIAH